MCGFADVDLEPFGAGGDREPLIAELPDHVKRLAYRLLQREAQLVLRDGALDLGAYVRRCLEETIGGGQAIDVFAVEEIALQFQC